LLKSDDGLIQCAAALALWTISPKGPEVKMAVSVLAKLLEDEDEDVEEAAAAALEELHNR
jgi:HEAT repeat protein